jgi:uncharacterized membrane protein (DUF4010 family)
VRTFVIAGLLGGISGWLASLTAPVVLAVTFLGLSCLLAVSYWVRLKEGQDFGLTTEIAFLLAFSLGAASVLGHMAPAAALLLSMKKRLHRWVAQIERLELEALLKLALISVVILPLLPDQGYGSGSTLNPYQIWWAVVVVAGLSFFGYAAMRLGGAHLCILLTGLSGGLASSISTTLALARLVCAQGSLAPLAAAGIVIAGSVTSVRILVLLAVFELSLIAPLAMPTGVMAVIGLAGARLVRLMAGRGEDSQGKPEGVANPLKLGTALSFGALLAIVLLAVHYLKVWIGTDGVYVAAALSGVTDVDALTISVAKLVGDNLIALSGATAIFIAASVNTVVKAVVSMAVGGKALGFRMLSIYAAVIIVDGARL